MRRPVPARRVVAGLVALLLGSVPVFAQEVSEGEASADDQIILDTITLSGNNEASGFDDIAPVTIIDRTTFGEKQAGSVRDMLRDVPGVTTQVSPDDPGTAINIRGLQDFGRVNVMVDGARQNFQRSGHGANGVVYFDPEMISTVDVVRGPNSLAYGSGAIAGVVNFTTLTLDDILEPGEIVAGRARVRYQTNGAGPLGHFEAAVRGNENFGALAAFTAYDYGNFRTGDVAGPASGSVTVPNTSQELGSGLFKIEAKPGEDHELTLSAMRYDNTFMNGVSTPRASDVIADTFGARYRYDPADNDWVNVFFNGYYTGTKMDQVDVEGDTAGTERNFQVGTFGFDLNNTSTFQTSSLSHTLFYGGDFFQDNTTAKDPEAYGQLTPDGQRQAGGFFLEDRIRYSSWLEVVAGARFDGYALTGTTQDGETVDNTAYHLSPKITVGITPWEPVTFYGGYSQAFRGPAITETLIDGLHPGGWGNFYPNPNLKPEVAHNFEAGMNLRLDNLTPLKDDALRLKAGVYHNKVSNYIDMVTITEPIWAAGVTYQNIADVTVEGVELEATYDAGFVFARVAGSLLSATNDATGEAVYSETPSQMTATLGFRALDKALSGGVTTILVGNRDNDSSNLYPGYGEGYGIVNLFANWQVTKSTTASLAIDNVFDRYYWQYLDSNPSPGLNAKLGLTIRLGVDG
ncbi:TonB-dependent hemoglobin/transferrin/lactoferrin family receptor [Segnochrobactraceae bacterium EtOH-i3]